MDFRPADQRTSRRRKQLVAFLLAACLSTQIAAQEPQSGAGQSGAAKGGTVIVLDIQDAIGPAPATSLCVHWFAPVSVTPNWSCCRWTHRAGSIVRCAP